MKLLLYITFYFLFSCSLFGQVVPKIGEEIKNQDKTNFTDFNKTRSNKGNLMEHKEKSSESESTTEGEAQPNESISIDTIQNKNYDFNGSFMFETIINEGVEQVKQQFFVGKNCFMIKDETSSLIYDFENMLGYVLNETEKTGTYYPLDSYPSFPFEAINTEGLDGKDTLIEGKKAKYLNVTSNMEEQQFSITAIYSVDPEIVALFMQNQLFNSMQIDNEAALIFYETKLISPDVSMTSVVRFTEFNFSKFSVFMKDYFR